MVYFKVTLLRLGCHAYSGNLREKLIHHVSISSVSTVQSQTVSASYTQLCFYSTLIGRER